MNLTIDQGNSSTKIGVFKNEELMVQLHFQCFTAKDAEILLTKYDIKNCILSSVIKTEPELIKTLESSTDFFIELTADTKLPIKNRYKTPQSLGKDRIAVVVAANYIKPKSYSLVIDAGTCITYDFINEKEEYLGGNISPGMNMRFKALNNYTQKLPLIESTENFPELGEDTKTAILSGVEKGIIYEMEGYINDFKKQHPKLSIFLTGGDTFFFETKLKYRIFASKNLLLIGLNTILNYNLKNV